MLSPGQLYKRVPHSPAANIRFRLWIMEKTRTDAEWRSIVREYCAQDFLFWVATFVFQVNPNKRGKEIGPFIPWEFQEQLARDTIDCLLKDAKSMLWEKSRELGATWWALLIGLWLCIFHPNKRVGLISHTEEAVTKAQDEGTLFAKIDFVLEHMPDWLVGEYTRVKKVYRFANRSTISAFASTERAGVGDRMTFLILDEFSKQKDAYQIWGQTADTGPRLVIGTHYDTSGQYYDLTQEETDPTIERPIRKRVLHWSMHPDKNKGLYKFNRETGQVDVLDKSYAYPPDFKFDMSGKPNGKFPGLRSPWYDETVKERKNLRDVAMHLDIDPMGASNQFFEPAKIRYLIETFAKPFPPTFIGDVFYDDDGNFTGFAKSPNGPLRMWVNLDERDRPPVSRYTAGADVSSGTGASNSGMSMQDALKGEKILEYLNPNIKPHPFARLCVALCRLFKDEEGNGARLVWEKHGPGVSFGQDVTNALGYRNVYLHINDGPLGKLYSNIPGWSKDPKSNRKMFEQYSQALYDFSYVNRSEAALMECLRFVYALGGDVKHSGSDSKNDVSGARENHGDIVIADALSHMLGKDLRITAETVKLPTAAPYGSFAWRMQYHERRERELAGWR